ncbi:MAG: MotA/TolQ/ExbB proton channel family protein [Pirellulales bacterium]
MWLAVTMPLWVGVLGFFQGMIASFIVISQSNVSPKPSEWAYGISAALATPYAGLILMAPSFLVAAIGSLIRSIMQNDRSA